MRWLRILTTDLSDRKGFLFSFVLGFVVRLIPEVLSYPYPIGFDTVYYGAMIERGIVWQDWTSIFSTWLLDSILIPIHQVTQVDPFALLKLAAPILYALNVCGVYYFSRKALSWSVRKSLTASLFCVFQLALLRLSWDLYRNMLGLTILLFTLPLIRGIETKKGFTLFVLMSVLVVFAHMLVPIVLFAVILGTLIGALMKGEKVRAVKALLVVLPALIIFVASVSLVPGRSNMPANVINTYEEPTRPGGLFFLANYLSVSDPVHSYSAYPDLVFYVLFLFSVLYLWWLPLVLIGFFRDIILDSWTLVFLVGSFNVLITPFCALSVWNRWMFMLVYPFIFYAVSGIAKVFKAKDKSVAPSFRWLRWMKVSRKATLVMFSIAVVSGSIFMTVPPFFDEFDEFEAGPRLPTAHSYLPYTMLDNTVPLRDVESTVNVMNWLNEHMNSDSSVLVHLDFLWWASLYLDQRHVIVYYVEGGRKALDIAKQHSFGRIYLVWWNESIDWYGFEIPKSFISVVNIDRISVFEYVVDGYEQS